MAFDEVRFPTDISLNFAGSFAGFNTDLTKLTGGHTQRNKRWDDTLGEWNMAYGIKTKAEMDLAVAFFMARNGMWRGFRFKDWMDYELARQVIATGTAAAGETSHQIYKRYSSGSQNQDRTIYKPVAGSDSVWINSVLKTGGGVDYTMSTTTGIITLTADLPNGEDLEVLCEFDVPARFDVDRPTLTARIEDLLKWGNLTIVETRDIA